MLKYATLVLVALLSTEVNAITVHSNQGVDQRSNQKQKMRQQIDTAINHYLESGEGSDAEWGFLKNIVNIDRFFAGPSA